MQGIVHGLKLLAVVVVADAVLTMFKQFCQRHIARVLMLASAAAMLIFPFFMRQM